MAIKTNFFDGLSYYPEDLIAQWKSILKNGVYNKSTGGLLTSSHSPANLSVDVAAGECIVNGYYLKSDAVTTVTIASNTSGYNRIDIIVADIDTTNKVGGIKSVMGTPSSSPTPPLPTANQIVIAEVFVGNNVSVINSGNITDKRTYTGITGTDISYSLNGHKKTEDGLIFQWGFVNISVSGGVGNGTITFPIAFPNSQCIVTGSIVDSNGISLANANVAFYSPSLTGVNFYVGDGNNGGNGSVNVKWFALGW